MVRSSRERRERREPERWGKLGEARRLRADSMLERCEGCSCWGKSAEGWSAVAGREVEGSSVWTWRPAAEGLRR